MKTNFFKSIFTLAIFAGFVACSNDDDEDILTIVGWKDNPLTWYSVTATGTVEYGSSDKEKAYARFVNEKMAENPANVNNYICLDFHDDGTFFWSGKRFGTGRYETNAKALQDCHTLTLIGISENQERINLPVKYGDNGFEIDISSWDISEVIARIIAVDFAFPYSDEIGYQSDFNTWQQYVQWVNSLKPTKATLKIKFDAIQRRF